MVPFSLRVSHHCLDWLQLSQRSSIVFESTCRFIKKCLALKTMCHLEHLLCLQSMLQPWAKWVAFVARAGCSLCWLQHPPPVLFLDRCHIICFPASFFHSVQLTFSFGCRHSLHVLILLCGLMQLWSDYIHAWLESHSVSKMAFADLCSNGLIICWPYNLIPKGQPLFSSCFMITYTSQG